MYEPAEFHSRRISKDARHDSTVRLSCLPLASATGQFVAWNVPPQLKLKGVFNPTTKHIFREAMKGVVPDEVLRQPKAGFAAPTDYWLANDLTEMTDDLLSDSNIRTRGLFRPEPVQKMLHQHRAGSQDWSMQIWQFLTLELWMRSFIDQRHSRVTQTPEVAIA